VNPLTIRLKSPAPGRAPSSCTETPPVLPHSPIDTHAILAVATDLGVVYRAATHGRGICTIKVSDGH
jgi:hypothetical protein